MKIAIIGNGQLGTYMYNTLSIIHVSVNMYSLNNGYDITNFNQLEQIVNNNDIIINCAALTNVDLCETDPDLSLKINQEAPQNLAKLCIKNNKKFIHISTDYVYGSNNINDNLTEHNFFKNNIYTGPINRYGHDKLLADEYIISKFNHSNKNNYLIIRPSWVFGSTNPNNFIEKIKNNLLSNKEIKVVDDQYGCPTSVNLIYNIIYAYIIKSIPGGLYNLRNDIENNFIPSRYDIACFIKDIIKSNCKILPCKTSDFILPAQRQLNSFLNINKIKRFTHKFQFNIPSWKSAIESYFKK